MKVVLRLFNHNIKKHYIPFSIYAGFVILHIWLGIGVEVPIIYGDEAGYVGNARFLAMGYGIPKFNVPYYPGYSFFIVPIFWFFNDMAVVYRVILIMNAFLLSLTSLGVYFLAEKLWPTISKKHLIILSLTVGLYPSFLLYSNVAMSENAYIPVFVFLCLLSAYAFHSRYWLHWLGIGAIAGFLYIIHPRALPVLIALGIISIRILWPLTKNIYPFLSLLVGLITITLSGVFIKRSIFGEGLEEYNTATYSISEVLFKYVDPTKLKWVIYELAGQAFYLSVSTYGLFIGGLITSVICLKKFFNDGQRDLMTEVAALIGLAMLGTWVLSSLYVPGGSPTNHLIYGRYNEGVLAPVLMLAFIGLTHPLWKRRISLKAWIICVIVGALVFGFLLFIGRTSEQRSGITNWINIIGLYQILGILNRIDVFVLAGLSFLVGLPVIYIARKGKSIAFIGLMGIFICSAVFTSHFYFGSGSKSRAKQRVLAASVDQVHRTFHKDVSCLSYDLAAPSLWHFFNYQIFMPRYSFELFDSRNEQPACSDLIITGRHDLETVFPGARLISLENVSKQGLWVLPGKLQIILDRAGFLYPRDFPGPLPESAYHSQLCFLTNTRKSIIVTTAEHPTEIAVYVKHKGKGSPWPSYYGLPSGKFSVRLGILWFAPGQTNRKLAEQWTELPHTMFPGDEINVNVTLNPVNDHGEHLDPKEYEVWIGLEQKGVAWFYQKEDSLVKLKVVVKQSQSDFSFKRLAISGFVKSYDAVKYIILLGLRPFLPRKS